MTQEISDRRSAGPSGPADRLAAARAALADEAGAGKGGRAALERYSASLDQIVREVFASAAPPAQPVAVLAVGGYGRRELCPHSDVDLLIMFEHAPGVADEPFVKTLLGPLWDLNLQLGHHVRSLADASEPEEDNPEFLVATLDVRPVAGDTALIDRLTSALHAPALRVRTIASLVTLARQRHATFNDTPYQLEPDLKDAPGGLRDVMTTRALARLGPHDLRQSPAGEGRLEAADDFLLRVRSLLHLRSGRNMNVLGHDAQEAVSVQLAFAGATPQQRVEALMREYFRHARNVYRSCLWVRDKMNPPPAAAPVAVGPNLERAADGIRFIDRARAAIEPSRWVELFEASLEHGVPVADEALGDIRDGIDRFEADDFYPAAEDRRRLVRLLRPRRGLSAMLSAMHDCGLLGALFPEFRKIASRVTRDFFHRYTVDEHTLLAIHNVDRLAEPAAAAARADARFAELLDAVESPELIVLALLFHDVGKWKEGNHVVESERLARRAVARLRLPRRAAEEVTFLIRHHLEMSVAAFRRDGDDPEVVKRFAGVVGVEDRLRMLCLLTRADVAAVGPDTLTPWKDDLLWRLYVDTYNELTIVYGDEIIEGDQAGLLDLLSHRPADMASREIIEFVEGLPRRYLQTFSRDTIYAHIALSRNLGPQDAHLTLEQQPGTWQLTVVTRDRPLLFSNVCGVLASFGMHILRGQAMTNPHGLVVDVFEFTDRERFLELNADARTELLHVMEEVLKGTIQVATLLRGRLDSLFHQRTTRVAPVVHGDNQASRRYTIVDIVADDRLGLLYRVSRVISKHGCDIDLVLISTEGHKAIDVFHITERGAKLTEAARAALTADIQHLLEDGHEAD